MKAILQPYLFEAKSHEVLQKGSTLGKAKESEGKPLLTFLLQEDNLKRYYDQSYK